VAMMSYLLITLTSDMTRISLITTSRINKILDRY